MTGGPSIAPSPIQLDFHIAAQAALAGQYEPVGDFLLRQQVRRLGQFVNLAALELALASPAAADATDGGNVDVLALRCLQQSLIGLDGDGLPVYLRLKASFFREENSSQLSPNECFLLFIRLRHHFLSQAHKLTNMVHFLPSTCRYV